MEIVILVLSLLLQIPFLKEITLAPLSKGAVFHYNNTYLINMIITNLPMSLHASVPMYTLYIVGSCLATKVFIGNLLAMGRGWVIIK